MFYKIVLYNNFFRLLLLFPNYFAKCDIVNKII